ncbi:MAG: hypothetical protein FVQ83_12730 [Chloroflexi bacterium]|nr:hypothetical protein [Chloroflexota bacterium]
MKTSEIKFRLPLLAAGIVSLLLGLWAGLLRMGWQWPIIQPSLPISHGPLMISGFLGTVISLERAVALGRRWMLASPLLSGLGALTVVFAHDSGLGPVLILLGSLGLVLISGLMVRKHLVNYTVVIALGAVAWLVGNSLWVNGRAVSQIVLWWAGFLVLTIAGERLELGRIARPSKLVVNIFSAIIVILLAGLIVSTYNQDLGVSLASISFLLLAIWLLRNDIARKTIRQTGLPRFVAACLLGGYVWLGVSGFLGISFGALSAGPNYDAFLHSLFLGFVMIMIFGHAPIIFPAVLGSPVSYQPVFYVHLALMHISLIVRLTGDLLPLQSLRMWGGVLNALAILLFFFNTVRSIRLGIVAKA